MDDFVVWLWMVVHHLLSDLLRQFRYPLFFHHYNFFKELLFVDTKIRYYFHSVKSFFGFLLKGKDFILFGVFTYPVLLIGIKPQFYHPYFFNKDITFISNCQIFFSLGIRYIITLWKNVLDILSPHQRTNGPEYLSSPMGSIYNGDIFISHF